LKEKYNSFGIEKKGEKIKESCLHPCRQNEKITKDNEKRMKEDEESSAPLYSYCE